MTGTMSSDGKLLDDDITPIKRHFVRSDGVPTNVNVDDWSLSIDLVGDALRDTSWRRRAVGVALHVGRSRGF